MDIENNKLNESEKEKADDYDDDDEDEASNEGKVNSGFSTATTSTTTTNTTTNTAATNVSENKRLLFASAQLTAKFTKLAPIASCETIGTFSNSSGSKTVVEDDESTGENKSKPGTPGKSNNLIDTVTKSNVTDGIFKNDNRPTVSFAAKAKHNFYEINNDSNNNSICNGNSANVNNYNESCTDTANDEEVNVESDTDYCENDSKSVARKLRHLRTNEFSMSNSSLNGSILFGSKSQVSITLLKDTFCTTCFKEILKSEK